MPQMVASKLEFGGLSIDAGAVKDAIHREWPLLVWFEPLPSRLPPWPRVLLLVTTMAVPSEAHVAEVGEMNPGMRRVAWGGL